MRAGRRRPASPTAGGRPPATAPARHNGPAIVSSRAVGRLHLHPPQVVGQLARRGVGKGDRRLLVGGRPLHGLACGVRPQQVQPVAPSLVKARRDGAQVGVERGHELLAHAEERPAVAVAQRLAHLREEVELGRPGRWGRRSAPPRTGRRAARRRASRRPPARARRHPDRRPGSGRPARPAAAARASGRLASSPSSRLST